MNASVHEILAWLFMVGAIMLAFAGLAHGQEPHQGRHGVGHERWHEGFYSTLKRNDTKTSCCNLADCTPTSVRESRAADGARVYEVMAEGEWTRVPEDKINKVSAPDGGAHVCFTKPAKGHPVTPEKLLCVVLPPET